MSKWPRLQKYRLFSEADEQQIVYDEVLKQSIRRVNIVVVISMISPFLTSSRYFILQLYMLSLPPYISLSNISLIIFGGYIWYALFTFLTTWAGDRYGHDKTMLFALVCTLCGVFTESMATNVWIFTAGYFLNRVLIFASCQAYIAYVLPHKHAIQHRATSFALVSVMFFLGPLLSGFVADRTSYRYVFWLNCILISICIMIDAVFIYGSQEKLQNMQRSLSMDFVHQQRDDDIFPVCQTDYHNTHAVDVSWKALFAEMDRYQLMVLCVSILQRGLCWTIENINTFYLAMFMVKRFDDHKHMSLLYISAMLLCLVLPFAITTIAVPKLVLRILPQRAYLVTVSSIFYLILMAIVICDFHSNHITLYWVLFPCIGIAFGCMLITTEMCILETQPKQHSGKIAALSAVCNVVLGGLGVFYVGLTWRQPYYEAFWIGQTASAFVVFLSSFVVLCIAHKFKYKMLHVASLQTDDIALIHNLL